MRLVNAVVTVGFSVSSQAGHAQEVGAYLGFGSAHDSSNGSSAIQQCGIISCLAEAGDIGLYTTPILHASDAAAARRHRRVLQIDYSIGQLPGGLEWWGV